MKQNNLNRQHWLEASFRALTKGGPSAIKAEAIARDIGVSKGSFYWHFKNVGALKSQMLAHWQEIATQAVIADLSQSPMSAADKLKTLTLLATRRTDANYGGPLVEAAIRDWARYDEAVGKSVKQVDIARIKFVETLFQHHGVTKTDCISFARIFYSSLIGLQALCYHDHQEPARELEKLLSILLTAQPGVKRTLNKT